MIKTTWLVFFMTLFSSQSFSSESWTIIANGSSIPIDELQDCMHTGKTLVLDGAINRFKSLPFYPNCLLGDFDSIEDPKFWGMTGTFSEIDEDSPQYTGNFGITIIPAKDQDYTDLEKGIIYCDKEGATSIHIVQATGGRMDHTLGNLGLLRKCYRFDRTITLITEKEQIFYVRDCNITIEKGAEDACAIMGYPKAVMSTTGLAYDGSMYPLELGIQESVCNTIVDPKATIKIDGEALIIIPKSSTYKITHEK